MFEAYVKQRGYILYTPSRYGKVTSSGAPQLDLESVHSKEQSAFKIFNFFNDRHLQILDAHISVSHTSTRGH